MKKKISKPEPEDCGQSDYWSIWEGEGLYKSSIRESWGFSQSSSARQGASKKLLNSLKEISDWSRRELLISFLDLPCNKPPVSSER